MTEKKTTRKYKKVKFTSGDVKAEQSTPNLESLTKSISENLKLEKPKSSYDLTKTVEPLVIKQDGKVDKNKVTFSSRDLYTSIDNIEQKGWKRMTDAELREICQVDPYISSIISTRSSQAAVIGRRSESRFDKGTRIVELKSLKLKDFKSREDYEKALAIRQKQQEYILSWFLSCGTRDKEVIDAAFHGSTDNTFKKCSLSEFISAQVRNLATFGRMGTQIFRDEDGQVVMFRPVPIETIYPVAPGKNISISEGAETSEASLEDAKEYNKLCEEQRPPVWVQRFEGRNVNVYTERDLKVSFFQKQALFDLNGFPLSPVEQAIFMVFVHQQTLGYLRNQYVKGMAAKGVISLESTDPTGSLSDEDLEQLRRDFHNYIVRNDNSSSIPIISGPVRVGFVSMSTNPSDMQFLQLEEHIVRALCSAFQISPQEMGYGHLSLGQGGLTQSNKQEEIIHGEERGLRMLLDTVFDLLNEILYENFPEAEKLYAISYTGVGEETREAIVVRGIQELQTTATLSSLWADSEKTTTIPFGGDVPLSPQFNQFVVSKMKYGEFREHFFGEAGASKKPEYDFIIDASLNQSYQQLKVNPIQQQQEQAQLNLAQQEMQVQQTQAQTQMIEKQMEEKQQQEQPQQEQAPEEPPQNAEELPKSLKQTFLEKQSLQKSMKTYFSEWIAANQDK